MFEPCKLRRVFTENAGAVTLLDSVCGACAFADQRSTDAHVTEVPALPSPVSVRCDLGSLVELLL
jgi:hypothetical protein